jgi:hypothetical protein
MAEVARFSRRPAEAKLPSSTTERNTRSWSKVGIPGAYISIFLRRLFDIIHIFRSTNWN